MAFKLKDGSGQEHEYSKEKLKIPSTIEGEYDVFTKGEVQEEKSVTITKNGTTEVMPDTGYGSVKKVGLTVDVPTTTVEPLTVTENGTTTSPEGTAYSPVTVNVPIPEYKVPQWNYEGINFVAWDGTLVDSWTLEELQTKTELPSIEEKYAPEMCTFPGTLSGVNQPKLGPSTGFSTRELAYFMDWNSTLDEIKENAAPAVVGMCYLVDRVDSWGGGRLTPYPPRVAAILIIFDIPEGGATLKWGMSSGVPVPVTMNIYDNGLGERQTMSPLVFPTEGTYTVQLRMTARNSAFTPFPTRLISPEMAKYVKGFLFPGTRNYDNSSVASHYSNFTLNAGISYRYSPFLGCCNVKHIALSPQSYYIINGQQTDWSPFDGCYSLESVSFPLGTHTVSGAEDGYFNVANLFGPVTDGEDTLYSIKQVAAQRMFNSLSIESESGLYWKNGMLLNAKSFYAPICRRADGVLFSSDNASHSVAGQLPQMEIVDLTADNSVLPFSNGFGFGPHLQKIKVPASLVDQYKAATGWSHYADFIVGV